MSNKINILVIINNLIHIIKVNNIKFIITLQISSYNITLQTWWSITGNNQAESILRNELGPARGEKRRKAGKKDKGRSDEGTYPILAGVAAGCRVQEGFEGSLIGSLQRDRLRERTRNLVNMGSMRLKCRRRRKHMTPSFFHSFKKGVQFPYSHSIAL